MPIVNPDHLLEQADRLLAPLGGGAPRQTDLRRAISSAYYAVFHAILIDAADDFVGRTRRHTPRYALVYRSIDHRRLRTLCEDIKKKTLPSRYSNYLPTGGFGADLGKLAIAIIDLQEQRNLADYDPQLRVRASDAQLAIAKARDALAFFRAANRSQRHAFLSLLIFSPR